jgi:hypothetical protein
MYVSYPYMLAYMPARMSAHMKHMCQPIIYATTYNDIYLDVAYLYVAVQHICRQLRHWVYNVN